MSITVTEREEQRMSNESRALGLHAWDVHQDGQLIGIFQNESDAVHYKESVESGRQDTSGL